MLLIKNSQKGFVPIIILAIVGVVAVSSLTGIYFLYQDQKNKVLRPTDRQLAGEVDTSTWKTGKTPKDLTFKYPSDWIPIGASSNGFAVGPEKDNGFGLNVGYSSRTRTLDEIVVAEKGNNTNVQRRYFDGQPGVIMVKNTNKGQPSSIIAYINYKNITYSFLSIFQNETDRRYKTTIDTILNSISFGSENNSKLQLANELNINYPDSDFTNKIGEIDGQFSSGTAVIKNGGGQYAWIAVEESGKWKIIDTFSEAPSCGIVNQYKVPLSIYGKCE